MVYVAVYILAVLAEIYFVPKFLKAARPKRCMKSLRYKMICSALFMVSAVCCLLYSGNYTLFSAFMLAGLVFGLIGDLLIHYPVDKNSIATLGGTSFAIGHIFYILAFSTAIKKITPEEKIFHYRVIIVTLCIVAVGVIIKFVKKIKLGVFAFPVLIYAIVIVTMLTTAYQLTFRMHFNAGVLFTLMLGAVLFVLSDASIVLLMFGGMGHNRRLKFFNIVTYFLGQILLGTSILFVK